MDFDGADGPLLAGDLARTGSQPRERVDAQELRARVSGRRRQYPESSDLTLAETRHALDAASERSSGD